MRVSDNGIDFICGWESVALEPYDDGAGYMTIGFGHRIKQGEPYGKITEEQARDLLMTDIEHVEIAVTDMVEREINQAQFDALASLAFNIGTHALGRSTLMAKLNGGKMRECGPQFDKWVFAGSKKMAGLVKRRAAERKLFETGEYDSEH